PAVAVTGSGLVLAAALAWLVVDTLSFRISRGVVDVTPVINLQFGAGLVVAASLAAALWSMRRRAPSDPTDERAVAMERTAFLGLLVAMGLWMGSLEIDRALAGVPMAAQATMSAYWALYGVGLVIAGFAGAVAAARYAGLALLSLTMVKVLFVDLANLESIWRVLSFLASGLLLIGTSVLYSRLSPKLLQQGGGLSPSSR
ncbi:MAG: DUF2339 domain-containing protein, partial [Planctomycetota bacterium]